MIGRSFLAGLILVIFSASATPSWGATWEGDVTTAWPKKSALCIELPENRSRHVSQMCFGLLGLRWQIGTFGGSPLSSVATMWDLQPTIFLRGDDNADLGRPIGAFSPAVQNAFKDISITGLDLAVNVLPNGGGAAVGIGLLPHAGNLGDAGDPYPGNSPSAYSWDRFFVSMSEGDACHYAKDGDDRPVYLAEDVAKSVMKDGFRLANLSACGASFSGLGAFSSALEKSCEAWASDVKREACKAKQKTVRSDPDRQNVTKLGRVKPPVQKPDAPAQPKPGAQQTNLDSLLAEVDAPDSNPPGTTLGESSETTPAPKQKKSLEMLLQDVEGGYAKTVQKQQVVAANAAAEAELKRCRSLVGKFDREVSSFEGFLKSNYIGRRIENPGESGNCSRMVRDMYRYYQDFSFDPGRFYGSRPPGTQGHFMEKSLDIKACVSGRRSELRKVKRKIGKIDFKGCAFSGSSPAEQFAALEKSVERTNEAFLKEARTAEEIHHAWEQAVVRADNAMAQRFYQRLQNSVGNLRQHVEQLGRFDRSSFDEYRASGADRTITTTIPSTTVQNRPTGQTNAPLTMDQGTLPGRECLSITNAAQQTRCLNEAYGRSMEQNRARTGGGSSGDTTAKTQ